MGIQFFSFGVQFVLQKGLRMTRASSFDMEVHPNVATFVGAIGGLRCDTFGDVDNRCTSFIFSRIASSPFFCLFDEIIDTLFKFVTFGKGVRNRGLEFHQVPLETVGPFVMPHTLGVCVPRGVQTLTSGFTNFQQPCQFGSRLIRRTSFTKGEIILIHIFSLGESC